MKRIVLWWGLGFLLVFVVVSAHAQNVQERGATFIGRVGINTRNPEAPLHVVSTFGGPGPTLIIANAHEAGTSDIAIDFHAAGDFLGNINMGDLGGPNARLSILQANPKDMHLTLVEGNGRVGIGTPTPLAKLHIEDVLFDLGTGNCPVGYTEGDFDGEADDADCKAVGIVANGNVGIGLTNPAHRLDVNGDVNTNDCYKEDAIQVAGTCASDMRLKKNIAYLSGSLEKVVALHPVRFQWRTEEFPDLNLYSGTETGLVGQDVEEIFPHLVTTDAKGFKRVRYGLELQMHMIQAIKELKTQNDDLRTRIRQLEAKLNGGQ